MPTLIETEYQGEVTWLGHVPRSSGNLRAQAVEHLDLTLEGDAGARHEGKERASCSRVVNLYPQGTVIRNVRQLTILSVEEMEAISEGVGLEGLNPGLLGASVVIRGIPDFTHVPPSARLQGPSGVTITVDMENRPCQFPAREIETDHAGHGKAFMASATGRRGVTAWVERPGALRIGEALRLFVPDQRAWAP